MSKKKITMKEVEERINILAYNLNVAKTTIDSVGIAFSKYLKFKNEDEGFKKYFLS